MEYDSRSFAECMLCVSRPQVAGGACDQLLHDRAHAGVRGPGREVVGGTRHVVSVRVLSRFQAVRHADRHLHQTLHFVRPTLSRESGVASGPPRYQHEAY